MGVASRAKPIAKPQEVLLVNVVQHRDHRPLDHFVLQGSDPKQSLAPIVLWDTRAFARQRAIPPRVDALMEVR
jgi:hypothetical protein